MRDGDIAPSSAPAPHQTLGYLLDGRRIRDVAIKDGRIAAIGDRLPGARTIDASGFVVAPGFIDLHSHGQDPENYRLKALDGVTTALELEIGVLEVPAFVRTREQIGPGPKRAAGRALIHFGTAVSHPAARVATRGVPMPAGAIVPAAGPATNELLSDDQFTTMAGMLERGLDAGALGIGMGLVYTPGATRLEVIRQLRSTKTP